MIVIGTSGYSFPDWVGSFYPPHIERSRMLDFYAKQFPAVEVNATYYRIPPPSTMHAMERKTPPGFEFVVKTHHDMTHKQSLDPELHDSFRRAVAPLTDAGKLSGFLAQFPQGFHRTAEHERFLLDLKHALPEDVPLFVEFRHRSWIADDLFPWLRDHGLRFVSVDEPDLPGLLGAYARATGDLAYVRFHGRNRRTWHMQTPTAPGAGRGARPKRPAGVPGVDPSLGPLFAGTPDTPPTRKVAERDRPLLRYDYLYSESELQEWVGKIRELASTTKKTFVFFNNCHAGQAATSAKLMRRLLEGEGLL
ncbi:MAG TPA: DUF72 domain-containing protein [Candidatus Eisenbacteria bacterium]|jgi:uncharacterized protein YecE (DUF72 family)|nr:DUF72 domain-containing protein [Candidatus Eisenbacteria bacterium]